MFWVWGLQVCFEYLLLVGAQGFRGRVSRLGGVGRVSGFEVSLRVYDKT